MVVKIEELRKIVEILLSHLESNGISEVELKKDHYWNIDSEERYEMNQQPKDHDVGQLFDDVLEIRSIINGQRPPLGYALVWLAAILRAVGEENVS